MSANGPPLSQLEFIVQRIDEAQRIVDHAQFALQEILRDVAAARQSHEYGIAKSCTATEPLLQCALQQVSGCGQYVTSALRTLTDSPDLKLNLPIGAEQQRQRSLAGSKTSAHLCEGRHVTSLIVTAPDSDLELAVKPQKDFSLLYRTIRPRLGSMVQTKSAMQAFLIPLVSMDRCSVGVEAPRGALQASGFTTIVLLGVASKLLRANEKKLAMKAVIVSRSSKVELIEETLRMLPIGISCINLLTGQRPAVPSESQPRLVVCSVKDI
ncbi:Hypothetical protein, putative, partial [Bodo saltans]